MKKIVLLHFFGIFFAFSILKPTLEEQLKRFTCTLVTLENALGGSRTQPIYCKTEPARPVISEQLDQLSKLLSEDQMKQLNDQLKGLPFDEFMRRLAQKQVEIIQQKKHPVSDLPAGSPDAKPENITPESEPLTPSAPPPPPLPGGKVPPPPPPPGGKIAPVKPVSPYLPPLSPKELEALTEEQKRASDTLIIEMLEQLAEYEYDEFDDGIRKFRGFCDILRKNSLFFKRDELAQFCAAFVKTGFGIKLSGLKEANDLLTYFEGLQLLFKTATENNPIQLIKKAFLSCLFYESYLSAKKEDDIIIYATSLAVSYRPSIIIGETTQSQRDRSDSLFLGQIMLSQNQAKEAFAQMSLLIQARQKTVEELEHYKNQIESQDEQSVTAQLSKYQNATEVAEEKLKLAQRYSGLESLAMHINNLRFDLGFLLYKKMLKSTKSSSGLQDPIVLFLRNPTKTTPLALRFNLQGYLFNKDTLDAMIDNDAIAKMLNNQYQQEREARKSLQPTIEQFLLNSFLKSKGIDGLKSIIASIKKDYMKAEGTTKDNARAQYEYNEEALHSLEKELNVPEPNILNIIHSIENITINVTKPIILPEDVKEALAKQIEFGAVDNFLLDRILESMKKEDPWTSFYNVLIKAYPDKKTRPAKVEQLLLYLTSIWSTARDLWSTIDKSLQLKILSTNKSYTEFRKAFSSYGTVLMAIQFFVEEHERGAYSWSNFLILRKALQVINKSMDKNVFNSASLPSLQLRVTNQIKIDGLTKPFVQPTLFGKEAPEMLPFVLLDRTLIGDYKGTDYYTGDIKSGAMSGKLTSLDAALNNWSVPETLAALNFYIDQFGQKEMHAEQLKYFVEKATLVFVQIFDQLKGFNQTQQP